MEMNVDKSMTLRISEAAIPNRDSDISKTSGECGIFELFG
jgi:hypothetical protein